MLILQRFLSDKGQTSELEDVLKVDSAQRRGTGNGAIFDNEQWYQVSYENAKVLMPENSAVTFLSRILISDIVSIGTVFFSHFLGLVITKNCLAVCFIFEKIPSGVVMREIPLAILEKNTWLDLVIRIDDKNLDFFCNGCLLNSVNLSGSLYSSYPYNLTIGKGPFKCLVTRKGSYFNGKIDHIAIWKHSLYDSQIASLSGLFELKQPKMDEISKALKGYNNIFNASVLKDIETCHQQEQIIRKVMDKDPYRPTFHLTSPVGWMFDPAGAFYYRGKYHVFIYRNICFLIQNNSLDHYASDDLIHWKQWPVGPFADCSLDCRGIWTNNHFIDDYGVLQEDQMIFKPEKGTM